MKAIRVIGWYGRRNSGDEAFKDVHRLVLPQVSLAWMQSKGGISYLPDHELRDDVVIVSAGDIILPFYFDQIPADAKIIVYGVGLSWDSQIELLKLYRERIIAIWIRNISDVKPLREEAFNAFYAPDIVFNLTSLVGADEEKAPDFEKTAFVIVSDNFRADMLRRRESVQFLRWQSFAYEFAAGLDYVAEFYRIVFVPFSFDENDYDLAAIHDIFHAWKEGIKLR